MATITDWFEEATEAVVEEAPALTAVAAATAVTMVAVVSEHRSVVLIEHERPPLIVMGRSLRVHRTAFPNSSWPVMVSTYCY